MEFIRKFIKRVGDAVGAKILANPFSFLKVTSVFVIILYFCWLESGELNFSMEEYMTFGIAYIVALSVFRDKDVPSPQDVEDKTGDKVEIKQNNISLVSFFRNTKR